MNNREKDRKGREQALGVFWGWDKKISLVEQKIGSQYRKFAISNMYTNMIQSEKPFHTKPFVQKNKHSSGNTNTLYAHS
jgi:hypothetical protein